MPKKRGSGTPLPSNPAPLFTLPLVLPVSQPCFPVCVCVFVCVSSCWVTHVRRCFVHTHTHRSEEHTSELPSHLNLVCRLLLESKNPIAGQGYDGACVARDATQRSSRRAR